MRILLVNDDGVFAPGIAALAHALKAEHELCICAPDSNRSFTSHYMTLGDITVEAVEAPGLEGIPAWSVSGSPADCTCLGLSHLAPWRPDIALSGINNAENIGAADILSSGTYNAAACATRLGLRAAALSLARLGDDFATDYTYAAAFASKAADMLASGVVPPGVTLNINIPGVPDGPKGVKVTQVGHSPYIETYEITDGQPRVFTQDWHFDAGITSGEGTDAYWNAQGYITVSPVRLPHADEILFAKLQELL